MRRYFVVLAVEILKIERCVLFISFVGVCVCVTRGKIVDEFMIQISNILLYILLHFVLIPI